MLTMYNRTYKQSLQDLEEEFPGQHYLLQVDDPFEFAGYLIAVSDAPDTEQELCALVSTFDSNVLFLHGGIYDKGICVRV